MSAPTILVVDDTPQNVLLLDTLLTGKGYRVLTASSGAEALRQVEAEKPDLVLLDVVMPQMSGYEVCRQIRANPDTGILPVVMVTALDPAQERVKGLEAGADDAVRVVHRPDQIVISRSYHSVEIGVTGAVTDFLRCWTGAS
jgi:adenylate cyclase